MIKEIDGKDIKEALDLVNNMFAEFVAKDYSEEGKQTFEDYLKIKLDEVTAGAADGQKKIWGYFENDRIIGVIAVRHISHIALFFVDKAYHGKGIGRKLFDHAVQFVKQNGKENMTVNSSLCAVPVYESLGFVITNDCQENDGIVYVPMENRNAAQCGNAQEVHRFKE